MPGLTLAPPFPSKRRIQEWFDDYFKHEDIDPIEGAGAIRSAMEESEHESDPDIALITVNSLFRGHGIEAIRGDYHVSSYFQDIVALYVNFGDTYAPTLLFETEPGLFKLTTWGDWVERHERKYKIL